MEWLLCRYKNQKKPSSGFVLTVLMLTLPLFLTCLVVLTSLIFSLRNYNFSQSVCISSVLHTQKNLQRQMDLLMKLNPEADRLRNRYRTNKKRFRRALRTGRFVKASVLMARGQMIQARRLVLHYRQQKILAQSLKQVHKDFWAFKRKMQPFRIKNVRQNYFRPYPLAVKARGPGPAPSYELLPSFSLKQTLSLFWDMPLYRFLPRWIKKWFFEDGFSSYECSATLKGKGAELLPALSVFKGGVGKGFFPGFLREVFRK